MATEKPDPAMDFTMAIVNPDSALAAAIEWMQDHMQPGDVFTADQLGEWARAAGFQRIQ